MKTRSGSSQGAPRERLGSTAGAMLKTRAKRILMRLCAFLSHRSAKKRIAGCSAKNQSYAHAPATTEERSCERPAARSEEAARDAGQRRAGLARLSRARLGALPHGTQLLAVVSGDPSTSHALLPRLVWRPRPNTGG